MMEIEKFYYVNCDTIIVYIAKSLFAENSLPILWNLKGMYGIVPIERVKNNLHTPLEIYSFYWDEIIPVPPEIAKILLGEQGFDNRTNDSNTTSTEETQENIE